jgi:16S rRNA (cytosine1402-N4)-methyltransferase
METTKNPIHKSVMIKEVLSFLNLQGERLVVDGTLGLGGYTEEILKNADEGVRVIAFEIDQDNLAFAKNRLKNFGERVIFVNRNFSELEEVLAELGFEKVDAVVLDLGLSSPHVDNAARGFSFQKDADLDMRFNQEQDLTAAEVVNKYSEKQLAEIFRSYGEEPHARLIAGAIVQERQDRPFTRTLDLANLIAAKVRVRGKKKIHPATKVFQALRIEVNKEMEALVKVLPEAVRSLKEGGRLIVVAYHSLEDKTVKMFFREESKEYVNLPEELTTRKLEPNLKIITRKPLPPTDDEVRENPRARSAKLRVAEKI